jgi:hypothetical protein
MSAPLEKRVMRTQAFLTVAWLLLVIPSVTIWKESVPWLVFMSVWANVAGHAAGWISAIGNKHQEDNGE